MKKLTLILLSFVLSGCAAVSETYTASGKKGYAINCSGPALGWDKCYKAAGDRCGTRGYTILDRSTESMAMAGASTGGAWSNKSNTRTMLIQCKR